MHNSKILGSKIQALRGNLSLRDFANKCGISHTTIDNLEKGFDPRTGKPTKVMVETLEKIANANGISITYFFKEDLPQQKEDLKMIKLKEILNEKGIKAKEIAKEIGVSESTMSLYINEKREPNLKTLCHIADYLNVSTDYILNQESPTTNITNISFANNIKNFRKNKRYTQQQIAEKIGISRQAYANYEAGTREPDIETIKRIANFYSVSVAYLFGEENIPIKEIGEIEKELLNICSQLNIKRKNALLTKAYEILESCD